MSSSWYNYPLHTTRLIAEPDTRTWWFLPVMFAVYMLRNVQWMTVSRWVSCCGLYTETILCMWPSHQGEEASRETQNGMCKMLMDSCHFTDLHWECCYFNQSLQDASYLWPGQNQRVP